MKYEVILNGRTTVEGPTAAAVVRELMKIEFAGPRSRDPAAFMRRAAQRLRLLRPDLRIRVTRPRWFIDDLVAAGFLKARATRPRHNRR